MFIQARIDPSICLNILILIMWSLLSISIYNLKSIFHFVLILTLLQYIIKTQIAFDALGVKIDRRYFLTIPKYTYTSV
jgi:hypothetical protein